MSDIYHGNFGDWDDVVMEFMHSRYNDDSEKALARKSMPEPEEVLIAVYDIDGYEGSAVVVYRNGDKFYSVYGSHCSCYGLEDQWAPEEHDRDTALAYWEKMRTDGYGLQERFAQQVVDRIMASLTPEEAAAAEIEMTPVYEAIF